MKIKTKLTSGVGLLLGLIILLAGVSIWYINNLKKDTNNILTANYNTLEYSRNMLLALDEFHIDPSAISTFELNLTKQKENLTEIGESDITLKISNIFSDLKQDIKNDSLQVMIRKDITTLMKLNMDAIALKSQIANNTAENAIGWIIITGVLCFIIAFALLIKLPGDIANPILQLTESIQQIANHNYNQRIDLEKHNEYGDLAKSFNMMAEKLDEYSNSKLEKILKEKKRVETLIDNMRDPVIGLDENKIIIFVNNEALKITGLTRNEILNKPIQDIAVTNDLIRTLIVDLINPSAKKDNTPLKIFSDDKECFFEKEIINIEINKTGENATELAGYVILLKNITVFKELDSAKTNFIATISHELKTPISSIKMSTQLLENNQTGILNEEQKQLIEGIKDDSTRLLEITGELLKMSQVETGNIQLNIHATDPRLIVNYAVETTKIQAEQKKLSLKVNVEADIPQILADAEKTAWVLINFLTNAIRYSIEESEVIISLEREPQGVLFSVRDFGKGIESRYKRKIFERYFQIPGSLKSGSGLGLAISKEFIETQGGTIGVDSSPGLGSTFFFILPYNKFL
ncbi:MAG: histidine kinase dimerization/phospho-acceptor domain-containing protein [Proteiniphilum sp.]|uniref:ATP-binding protein n=1 Tax=Proteiniphilum sp. TaxID=1926877 RepID=UPI002B202F98|nr:ATP-binding protein [Proteiniphilum sp.]MEA5128171.1 histidine kinase dimerization/phospho-acceptor domain-containing protein [Proteiniphilum sp.]